MDREPAEVTLDGRPAQVKQRRDLRRVHADREQVEHPPLLFAEPVRLVLAEPVRLVLAEPMPLVPAEFAPHGVDGSPARRGPHRSK
jgi:hypothetical protein